MSTDLPSMGRFEQGVHLLPARVYYEDTDFTGVVYHANYLRFFERGRSEFLRLMAADTPDADPGAFAVVRLEIDYKAPARIHDGLVIRTAFAGLKGPRMFFEQQAEKSGNVLCRAVVTATPIQADGRVRRPSPAEIALWTRYQAPAALRP